MISASAIQTHRNTPEDDPFAGVFEGVTEEDVVISDTGQYKFVGSLLPKKPIMPNSEVDTGAADGWQSLKGNDRVSSLQCYKIKTFQILFSTHGMIPNRKIGSTKVQESQKWGCRKKS